MSADIRPIATQDAIDRCALLMANSEPWRTLGRDIEDTRRALSTGR